jgi:hypothetical protein
MASDKKIEANRRNAQKSTGPKSAEGKSRSRHNALKHGMRATLAVLPGEDEAAYAWRMDAWTSDLKPRNPVEQYLVDRAVKVSWQLDRIERAYVARLTANIKNAAADPAAGVTQPEAEDVPTLGARLFWDARGPMQLYPNRPHSFTNGLPLVSWSGLANDPNLPAQLVHSLEATAEGCGWLLDRWAELSLLLQKEKAWQSPDKLKAIRLLGRQPIDAFDDSQVATVFVACHKIDPSGGELFHEIWNELSHQEIAIGKRRLTGRPMESLTLHNLDEAREELLHVIDRAVARLRELAEKHRTRAEANASLTADLLAFDGSVEGERIRRFEASCSRTLLRTLDAFDKRHRAADDDDFDPVVPASIDECVPISAAQVEPDVEINPVFATESINEPIDSSVPIADPAISQPAEPANAGMQSHCDPDPTGDNPGLTNEPTALTSPHHPDAAGVNLYLTNEPTALSSPHHTSDLTNEPNAPTSPHHGGSRKQIESVIHRGDWGKKALTGPNNRRERRARRARSQKTGRDITCLLAPGKLLAWKPP